MADEAMNALDTEENQENPEQQRDDRQKSSGSYLMPDQLKRILSTYRSKLPSAVVNELYQSLKTMDLSEEEAVSIINEVVNKYHSGSKEELEHIMMRLQKNDMLLKNITDKLEVLVTNLVSGGDPNPKLGDLQKKPIDPKQAPGHPLAQPGSQQPGNPQVSQPGGTLGPGEQQVNGQQASAKGQQPGIPGMVLDNRRKNDSQQRVPGQQIDQDSVTREIATKHYYVDKYVGEFEDERDNNAQLLSSIKKDPFSMAVLMRWIEFLLRKVGQEKLSEVLDYYLDIGWVSEEVVLQILTYSKGMEVMAERTSHKKLTPEDHFKTLLFIEKLRGTPIDRLMLTKMERELALLTKKSEDYEDIYGL